KQRRIEVALVIGDEDISLIAVEVFKPRNVYARASRPYINPQPELRRRGDEIFDAQKIPQDVARCDCRNAYENQQQKRDDECPVVSNHMAREWGMGNGEWGIKNELLRIALFLIPHSPFPVFFPYSLLPTPHSHS